MNIRKLLANGFIISGAAACIYFTGEATKWHIKNFTGVLDILFPYVVLFILSKKPKRPGYVFSSELSLIFAAFLVSLLNIAAYYNTINSRSSTSSLDFVFVPLYSSILVILIYFPLKWIIKQVE
jgi:hypothetical protein